MKMTSALLVLLLAAASPARALEWHAVGPRAIAMGGAGVALAEGPLAAYWNPAALGRPSVNAYGLQIPFGVHVALTGSVYEGAKNLQHLKDRGTQPTNGEISAALDQLDQPGGGLRLDGGFGTNFRAGKLGVFFNASVDAGAMPQVDRVNASAANITGGMNNSKLIVNGINLVEIGAAYGHELPFAPGLYLGGAVKVMGAHVGYADYFILRENNESGDIASKFKDNAEKSSNVGVDLGMLWDLDRTFDGVFLKPRVGLVARNINNPKFKRPAAATAAGLAGKFAVNPQVRLGAVISPFGWWNFAADVDLTRNLTPVDNAPSRQFSLGSEFNVFNRAWINIPLRVGLRRNTAETSAGTMLTAGAGLNLLHFMLDLSAGVSNRRVTTSANEKIAREAMLGAQLSVLFGGSDEPASPRREWKAAPDQPASSETIRKASEKAQEELRVEELKNAAPAEKPSAVKP